MPLVLDASVAIAASLNDERSDHRDYAARALRRLVESGGHVPSLWRAEIANTLLVAERRRRLASSSTLAILAD